MRKNYPYIIALIMSVLVLSCTADIATSEAEDSPISDTGDAVIGIIPEMETDDEDVTRSTLIFSPTLRAMTFAWEQTDAIGVFPYKSTNISTTQQKFGILPTEINGLSAKFKNDDDAVPMLKEGEQYVSYSPFSTVDENKNAVHATFRNQIQKESVNMDAYYQKEQSNDMMNAYLESEAKASAHLGKYDYMVSSATAPVDGKASFHFTRLGSIVRFYLRIPAEGYYDSIQVINKDANFIIDADLDITKSDAAKAFVKPVTSHIVSLAFRKDVTDESGNVTGQSGFDLYDSKNNPYYGEPSSGRRGYIIAYMMFAPINLKADNIGQSTLYLLGHDKSGNRTYYRAKDKLSKINIAQNKTQQWAPAQLENDQPIDFVPVEVEIWKDDTNFDNNGTGTDEW